MMPQAENLKFGDSEQSANPYCVCSSGGETLFRTGVLGDTLSPTWNHTFDVPEYLAGTDLEFAVFEEDDGDESIFLGSAHLPPDFGLENAFAFGAASPNMAQCRGSVPDSVQMAAPEILLLQVEMALAPC